VYGVARGRGTTSLRVLDFGVIFAAWLLGYLAGFAGDAPFTPREFIPYLLIPIAAQLFVNQVMGLYGPVWRYASVEEAVRVVAAASIGIFASTFALAWYADVQHMTLPLLTAPPVAALLILLGCGGIPSRPGCSRSNASATARPPGCGRSSSARPTPASRSRSSSKAAPSATR